MKIRVQFRTLCVRPRLVPLEDRLFPGQAGGIFGWTLAGTGLAFLDQELPFGPLGEPTN